MIEKIEIKGPGGGAPSKIHNINIQNFIFQKSFKASN
jgi:hypothetical protein